MVIVPCGFHHSHLIRNDDADQLVSVSIFTYGSINSISKMWINFRPNSSLETLNANAASMWVKIVSSWLCLALYTWSLIAPIVLPDREFGSSF